MAYGLTKSANLVRASAQKFTAPDNSFTQLGGTSFTIEGWFNFASTGNLMFLADKVNANGAGYRYYFASNALNLTIASQSSGADGTNATVAWTPTTATWYHIALTYALTSGDTKFYINGIQQGATQTNEVNGAYAANGSVLSVCGEAQGGARTVDGEVSLFRLWNTNLSSATILANMCNVYGTATTNLQAEWSLDNVLTDGSGNGSTLTNVNTATFVTDTPSTCASVTPPTITDNPMMQIHNTSIQFPQYRQMTT